MFLVFWFRYRNKHDRPASQSALVVQQRDDLTQSIRAEGPWGEWWLMRNTREHEEGERKIAYTLRSRRFFFYMFKWLSNDGFSTLCVCGSSWIHLVRGCSTYREWYIYRTSGKCDRKCANFTFSLYAYFNDPSSAFVVCVELWPLCWQAHLVAAFEKSLGNMTCRLTSLTMTAEQKVHAFFCCCGPPLPDTFSCMKSRL